MPSSSNKTENRGRMNTVVYNVRHMRRWEKVFCSFLLGFVIAASTSQNLEMFMDSFVMVFVYTIWLLISLPSLYKKVTATFVKTALYTLVQTFFADALIFGLYRYLRRHISKIEVSYDAIEQRGYIMFMNGIRLLFLVLCLARAFLPAETTVTKKGRKKSQTSWLW